MTELPQRTGQHAEESTTWKTTHPLHIAIVGPAEPREFSAYLSTVSGAPMGMGGVPVNVLVDGLLRSGHRVSLITASPSVTQPWTDTGTCLDVVVVPFRPSARARAQDLFLAERRAIAGALCDTRADVIHAHWTYEFALGAMAAKASPLLITAHDAPLTILRHLPDGYRMVRTAMAYWTRSKTRELTAVSPYLAERWRRQMLYRRPISVIPNPLPSLDLVGTPKVGRTDVLSVSNASRLKNVRTLLRAFATVRSSRAGVRLRLVGPGLGPSDHLAEWARREDLSDGVHFIGSVGRAELAREYSNAAVFCHTSLEESQGMVLLEALSAGLPVVAGVDSGGVAWTLFDGNAGRLVDVRHPEAIAQAIIETLDDPSSTTAPGFDVAGELEARYSAASVASQYVTEYRRLIGATR